MRQDRISGRRFENPNSLPPALMRLAKSILNCPHAEWRMREGEREMSCNGGGAREIINGEKVVGRAAGAAPELLPSLLLPRRRGQAGRPEHRMLELHLVQAFGRCLVPRFSSVCGRFFVCFSSGIAISIVAERVSV